MKTIFNTPFIPLFLGFLIFFNGCNQISEVSPQRKDIVDAVFASGHIENLNQYSVNANVDGFLTKIYVVEGDSVKSGSPLFFLSNEVQHSQVENAHNNLDFASHNAQPNSPQINQLKLQIIQAKEKLKIDSMNFTRFSRLVQNQAVSKVDADNAELQYKTSKSNLGVLENNLKDLVHNLNLNLKNAKAQLDIQKETNEYYSIKAKSPGIILSISKKQGDYVKKGDILSQIGSGQIIAKLYIAEDDIHRVKLGQRVLISLNSDKNIIMNGTLLKIYPSFDQNDQSFIVDARFDSTQNQIINGTQLQANIIVDHKSQALVIPSNYLINGDFVYIKGQKNKIPVKVGIRTLEFSEILSGLTGSEKLEIPKN